MLQIQHICKQYKTGSLVQQALDHVSLNLRDSEFVAILGPSGSGKTTLLNIIGGLDRYDSGDLIINGISTKNYKDRDWDSYRNHTIGFVFQSYNLIPHQTVLSNVELALTISGISKGERRKRAMHALEQVGLGDQMHKKPSQMSGGQMQRVAIARALVNDPDILLADEPTGALDSETSVQVMELLKAVARDRLVVMVTHNPELAGQYATRIVRLKDGIIRADSDPFEIDARAQQAPVHRNMGKSSMSFLTALSLSFHNLQTKKARTILTSFAGSIGIIGIALILAISTGVNQYIQTLEEETLSEYPLQIQNATMDFTSLMVSFSENQSADAPAGEVTVSQMLSNMFSRVEPNDLASLKEYLDSGDSNIGPYAKAVEYSYSAEPQIYSLEGDSVRQVNPDRSFAALGVGADSGSFLSSMMNTNVFYQLPENTDLFEEQYEVKAGHWPQQYNECVVVLSSNGSISDFMLYTLGLRDSLELDEMIEQFLASEEVTAPVHEESYRYEDFLGITFQLVNASDCYVYDETYEIWKSKSDDEAYLRNLVRDGEPLTVVGVVQPAEDASAAMLSTGIAYPTALTEHVVQQAAESQIVQEQMQHPETNVLTGNSFGEDNSQSRFDLESLFTIDEDAMQKAFSFDTDALEIDMSDYLDMDGSMNLSQMIDPDDIAAELPDMPELDMGQLLGQLDLTISAEGVQQLAAALLAGYNDYAAEHPEADYSRLNEYFLAYLQTPEAQQILQDAVAELMQDNITVSVSVEQLQALIEDILSGFPAYAAANGMTDPDRFGEYLTQYLESPEVQQKLAEAAAGMVQTGGEIEISQEQMQALVDKLTAGYQEYAAANQLPDPSKMGEHFEAYLQTPEAQQIMAAGIAAILDTDALQQQLSRALGSYMQSAMSSYTEAVTQAMQKQISAIVQQMANQMSRTMQTAMQRAMNQLSDNLQGAFRMDADAFADAIQMTMSEEELTELLRSLMSGEDASYSNNLASFGYADLENPSQIAIYPYDFDSKAAITAILDDYNSRMESDGEESKIISYTDMVGTLMSSVTEIVDTISYVLVAFVAISLVVSSIMIGVITYISVLERRKEIGVLRAIGASRHNISQVFNAETIIIGFCAGVMGIALTLLLLIPGNAIIHSLTGTTDINAALPVVYAAALIALSVVLTLIGGLIPSSKAAKSDPVAALRAD